MRMQVTEQSDTDTSDAPPVLRSGGPGTDLENEPHPPGDQPLSISYDLNQAAGTIDISSTWHAGNELDISATQIFNLPSGSFEGFTLSIGDGTFSGSTSWDVGSSTFSQTYTESFDWGSASVGWSSTDGGLGVEAHVEMHF